MTKNKSFTKQTGIRSGQTTMVLGAKTPLKVGDTVELMGNHPFSGHKGEVVGFGEFGNLNTGGKFKRPKIRLYDMGDHEVYAMKDSEVKVLR